MLPPLNYIQNSLFLYQNLFFSSFGEILFPVNSGGCQLDSGVVLELACYHCPPSEAVESIVGLFWNWWDQHAVVVRLIRLSA